MIFVRRYSQLKGLIGDLPRAWQRRQRVRFQRPQACCGNNVRHKTVAVAFPFED